MNGETYWRQRYEMLMANFGDVVRAATVKQPVLLSDKESYELGKLHGESSEREAIAKMLEDASGTGRIVSCTSAAKAIRARGQA